MAFSLEDRMRMVDAKLIEKHTFLHLRPQDDTADDCSLSPPRLKRSLSDTFVHYGSETDSEESTRRPSCSSSLTGDSLEQFPSAEQEEYCSSSQTTDTEDDEGRVVLLEHMQPAQRLFTPEADDVHQAHQTNKSITPQHEQLYYYIALQASPTCGSVVEQRGLLTCPSPTSKSPATSTREALQWEAHAAKLRAEAARLKAAALQCEAVAAQGSPVALPTQLWPTWNGSKSQPLEEQWSAGKQACKQSSSLEPQCAPPSWHQELTTLMLRNIPNDYTRTMLLELLDYTGFSGKYDFVYLPVDFCRMSSLGYAFVNFVSHGDADLAKFQLQGFSQWKVQSQKICQVCWGEPLQGLEAHIDRYRSSPVMHHSVPDEFKPIIFKDGVRVSFPPATKRVRKPRSNRNDALDEVA